MSRSISLTARQAVYAQETEQVFLLLLTITHVDLSEIDGFTGDSLYFVLNSEDVTSRGNVYIAYPFDITLPGDNAEEVNKVRLAIDNIDRQIVQAVRNLTSAPTVLLEIVLASSSDTLEAGPFEFSLQDVDYGPLVVEGSLGDDDFIDEPFPGDAFTPGNFPGLF